VAVANPGLAASMAKEVSTTSRFKAFLSRYFYLCMALVLASLVIAGFSRTVNTNLFHASPPRPFLLWMHGAAFSTWIMFFIAQSALVRSRKVSVHRLLGWFGAGLAAVMVVLGFTIAVVMTRFDSLVLINSANQVYSPESVRLPHRSILCLETGQDGVRDEGLSTRKCCVCSK
jgi:hypothetical protein